MSSNVCRPADSALRVSDIRAIRPDCGPNEVLLAVHLEPRLHRALLDEARTREQSLTVTVERLLRRGLGQ